MKYRPRHRRPIITDWTDFATYGFSSPVLYAFFTAKHRSDRP